MHTFHEHTNSFLKLFKSIKLDSSKSADKLAKVKQILSYLEVIDSQVRKFSKKQRLILVDSAAGNCYLSFLLYHYYHNICGRDVEIHCIDHNATLMNNAQKTSQKLGFSKMYFHSGDILKADINGPIDILYTLHSCDNATDKSLYLGIKLNARSIFSVTCCQHTLLKQFKGKALRGVTRFKSFKSRIAYYIADAMRAHLLSIQGYEVDIFDFTSTRNTDKNIMLRAKRNKQIDKESLWAEYQNLKNTFSLRPQLEELLTGNTE